MCDLAPRGRRERSSCVLMLTRACCKILTLNFSCSILLHLCRKLGSATCGSLMVSAACCKFMAFAARSYVQRVRILVYKSNHSRELLTLFSWGGGSMFSAPEVLKVPPAVLSIVLFITC